MLKVKYGGNFANILEAQNAKRKSIVSVSARGRAGGQEAQNAKHAHYGSGCLLVGRAGTLWHTLITSLMTSLADTLCLRSEG